MHKLSTVGAVFLALETHESEESGAEEDKPVPGPDIMSLNANILNLYIRGV